MFNTNNEIDAQILWNYLGTFYQNISPEEKEIVQSYWTALFDGMEAMHFNLAEAYLGNHLILSSGFIESTEEEIPIDPKYFRGDLFLISGSNNYLSIPTLEGIYKGNVLYEDVDYTLDALKNLRFTAPLSIKKDVYKTKQAVVLPNILLNVFFPGFGEKLSPQNIILGNYYPSYIKNWSSLPKNEKMAIWGMHLMRWAGALFNRYSRGPTIKNIREGIDLIHNLPFSYSSGTVDSITSVPGFNEIVVNNYTYSIPDNLVLQVSLEDSIKPGDLFCEGSSVDDYYTNPSLISGLWPDDPHPELRSYYTVAVHITNDMKALNYYPNYYEFFKTSVIPPGVTIKEY